MLHGSIKTYISGFILSLLLTFGAYYLVTAHLLSGSMLVGMIITLALVQMVIQLLFFLHLGQESKPRWNLIMFLSTIGIILTVVIGSLWIMSHLNYRMMPQQVDQYIMRTEGMQK